MVTGYCVKCKEKNVEMEDPAIHQTKRGGYMAKGDCPTCSTTICAMMSQENAEQAMREGARKAF